MDTPTTSTESTGSDETTAAQAYGWQEDWRESLTATQEVVVHALQRRVIQATTAMRATGEVKDLAVCLGVAVDKLSLMHEDAERIARSAGEARPVAP